MKAEYNGKLSTLIFDIDKSELERLIAGEELKSRVNGIEIGNVEGSASLTLKVNESEPSVKIKASKSSYSPPASYDIIVYGDLPRSLRLGCYVGHSNGIKLGIFIDGKI